jgi:predicted kinase
MRGIPGSGKSTLVSKMALEAYETRKDDKYGIAICSADKFFMGPNGYDFKPNKLGEAHKECLRDFIFAVQNKMSLIFVDNTNINIEDASPYIAIGEVYDYEVEVIQVNVSDVKIAADRNVHGVPYSKILEMYHRLTNIPIPHRWKFTFVNH